MEGVGVDRIGHFLWTSQIYDPTWFKITANSVIRGSSFFFNIKPYITIHLTFIENNAQLPFPHYTDDQTKGTVTASLHLTFYLKKVVD